MDEVRSAASFIISYWNEFAEKNNYPKQNKNNDKIRRKVRARLYSDETFLQKVPYYFDIINKNCQRRNEFGDPLNLYQFLRASTILRALLSEKGEEQ